MANGFKELDVWKKSHQFVLKIYKITETYPTSEKYRITDQMMRSAMSIALNIAEGTGRKTKKDFTHFLIISRGSVEECKYLILLSKDLGYLNNESYKELLNELESISRMLNALIKSINNPL